MMLDAAATHLRFVSYTTDTGSMAVLADLQIALADIVSVELVQHDEKITYQQVQTYKNGAIGRALVGEMIGGGTGAIVGALSAPSRTAVTTVEQTRPRVSELVFGLNDLNTPVRRFASTDHTELDRWLYRIRSALLRQSAANVSVVSGSAALPRAEP